MQCNAPFLVPNVVIQSYNGIVNQHHKSYDSSATALAMVVRERRYSKEELARRGQELYESSVRQQVESGNTGKIIAILQ